MMERTTSLSFSSSIIGRLESSFHSFLLGFMYVFISSPFYRLEQLGCLLRLLLLARLSRPKTYHHLLQSARNSIPFLPVVEWLDSLKLGVFLLLHLFFHSEH